MTLGLKNHGDDSSNRILFLAFLFSVLVHLAFFTSFPTTFFPSPSVDTNHPKNVIRVKRVKPQGQLVDIQDQKNITDQLVDTDYLSDKNRKVEKQTRSLNITHQQNQTTTAPTQEHPLEKKSKYSLNLSDRAIQDLAKQSKTPLLLQSMSSNYLPDMTIGTETLLNTKEFAFNSFYIRMKRDIEAYWRPGDVLGHNANMLGTYITTVNVVLDEEGELVQDPVIKSSGIEILDEIATEAIERASPFPNPPKELSDDDHKIRMNWTFIFQNSPLR